MFGVYVRVFVCAHLSIIKFNQQRRKNKFIPTLQKRRSRQAHKRCKCEKTYIKKQNKKRINK